jgi:hypothetical protein
MGPTVFIVSGAEWDCVGAHSSRVRFSLTLQCLRMLDLACVSVAGDLIVLLFDQGVSCEEMR